MRIQIIDQFVTDGRALDAYTLESNPTIMITDSDTVDFHMCQDQPYSYTLTDKGLLITYGWTLD